MKRKSIASVQLAVIASLGMAQAVLAQDHAKIDLSKLPPAATQTGVTYEKDILPIFKESCTRCHGGANPKAKLNLETLAGAIKGSKDGSVVTAGKSDKSDLVIAVSRLDPESAMPPPPRNRRGGPPGGPAGGPPPGGAIDGGIGGPGGPGGPGRGGPPGAKPLTPEQVGLVRAWIDQGAK